LCDLSPLQKEPQRAALGERCRWKCHITTSTIGLHAKKNLRFK
jgi:hypothetical protein